MAKENNVVLDQMWKGLFIQSYDNYNNAFGEDNKKKALYGLVVLIENNIQPNIEVPKGKHFPLFNYKNSYILEEGCDCPNGLSVSQVEAVMKAAHTYVNQVHSLITKGYASTKVRLRKRKPVRKV